MRKLRTFGNFWYDFIVGDDWRIALGVTVAIAVAFAVAHEGADQLGRGSVGGDGVEG